MRENSIEDQKRSEQITDLLNQFEMMSNKLAAVEA